MKTTWQIITLNHKAGPLYAMALSRFRVGQTNRGQVCVNVEAETFTYNTFLVVAKWKRIETRVHRMGT